MSVWADKLKLSKPLVKSVTEAGYLAPKEIQARTLSRIAGGQDFIAVAPEGAGKTTSYVLGILSRLKQGLGDAPRSLILAPDSERVIEIASRFELLNRNKSIKIASAFAGPSLEAQMEDILNGADIVVATPDRARAIYLKLGLNLNKILVLVVDDAHLIVKQGLQLPVAELANSIRNCQHLVFTEVLHEKLEKMIDPFMKDSVVIEVEELGDESVETIPQILYQVPNYRTKINLLQLLLDDAEVFTKAVVFVNTRFTAEKLYQNLMFSLRRETAVLNPVSYETPGFNSVGDFVEDDEFRLLIIANETKPEINFIGIPFLIHFELPQERETYVSRVLKQDSAHEEEAFAITFSTDIELDLVRKIEQTLGKKMEIGELPENLLIEKEPLPEKAAPKKQEETRGEAFHEKKASNMKDYNYGAGLKAKMTKKRKH